MAQPRLEPRHIVPAISVCIEVEFQVGTKLLIGRLWDISLSGACLLFPRRHVVTPGQQGPFVMNPPNIGEPIRGRAEVLWVDRLNIASFAGVRFLQPIAFDSTFLAVLMRSTARPCSGMCRHEQLNNPGELFDLDE